MVVLVMVNNVGWMGYNVGGFFIFFDQNMILSQFMFGVYGFLVRVGFW